MSYPKLYECKLVKWPLRPHHLTLKPMLLSPLQAFWVRAFWRPYEYFFPLCPWFPCINCKDFSCSFAIDWWDQLSFFFFFNFIVWSSPCLLRTWLHQLWWRPWLEVGVDSPLWSYRGWQEAFCFCIQTTEGSVQNRNKRFPLGIFILD